MVFLWVLFCFVLTELASNTCCSWKKSFSSCIVNLCISGGPVLVNGQQQAFLRCHLLWPKSNELQFLGLLQCVH